MQPLLLPPPTYLFLPPGGGGWVRVLCTEAVGDSLLGSKLLWRLRQCRGDDDR